MASPVLDGWGASLASPAAVASAAPAAAASARSASIFASAPSALGIGLVVALLILAYWYRRVL